VPHTFGPKGNINSDPDACHDALRRLHGKYQDRIHVVTGEYDQSEIKGIISLCNFFIGSRMHACIAALSQEIPTAGVAYSQKFAGVFESVGAADWVVDGRFLDTDAAVDRIIHCFQNRSEMKANLQKNIGLAKSRVMATFRKILSE
jgi:polysaccharide pyruvyl transferase WcaK-like protein